jgi:NodT family efflux transporter outer membrane factor (OMF) lipoprotein
VAPRGLIPVLCYHATASEPQRTAKYMANHARIVLASALMALAACTVGPDYKAPDTTLPPAKGTYTVTDATPWWQDFNDPALNALITQAAEANPTVRQALAAVAGAREQIVEARAGGMPQLNASLGGTDARSFSPPGYVTAHYGSASFDASWEIDLWGKQRRTVEAANDNADAAQAAADAAALTLRGEVARIYIAVRAAQALLAQLQSEVTTAQYQLHVASTREAGGDGTGLEKLQAQLLLLSAQSRIPTAQANVETNTHALAALCGSFALPADMTFSGTQPSVTPPDDAGVPADLLRRRPDVREAERQLAQATAEIGVAEAARLPTLALSGSIGVSGNMLNTMMALPIFALGSSVKMPIFDAGAASARIAEAHARTEAALWSYREAVATAVKDVQDSWSNLASARSRMVTLKQQVATGTRAVDIAVRAFHIGLVDFTTVISVQQTLNQANEDLIQARADEATYLVALDKALGGGYAAGVVAQAQAANKPAGS